MTKIKRLIQHRLLQHAANIPPLERLVVSKAKWWHNADSPALFMIDDLTNAWAGPDIEQGPEYDWGGKHFRDNSAITFLKNHLFDRFPSIKTTYFTVAGEMHSFDTQSRFTSARPLDSDEESQRFFRTLERSVHSEIAYHGLHHGVPCESAADYIQEWESFGSVEAGLATIAKGKDIFKRLFGYPPQGGKYGGYKMNSNSEETIAGSDFFWWCREWTPRDTLGRVPDQYYELDYFGDQGQVVGIPTTVHGKNWKRRQIDKLLECQQVIAVQEHISPRRPDGKVQTPNIFDDIGELAKLYDYLSGKNIWYATCSELATYFIGITFSRIFDVQRDSFQLEYSGRLQEPLITLLVDVGCLLDAANFYLGLELPGGQRLSGRHIHRLDEHTFMIDIPVRSGRYHLYAQPAAEPCLQVDSIENGRLIMNFDHMAGLVDVDLPENCLEASDNFLASSSGALRHEIFAGRTARFYCCDSSEEVTMHPFSGLYGEGDAKRGLLR